MEQPIITGILSYGMSGRVFHAPFVHANPFFDFYAVTERSQKRASLKYPGIISYDSVEDLVNDPKIELVIVNTPNHLHYEHAKMALEAGKHVLVEKPFAATSRQARELFALGRKNDCKVMVYQNRRWDSDYQSVRSVVEEKKLGKIIEVHFRFDRYRREISHKYFKEENFPASGLSYDLGPHLLDQAISLFGKPASFTKTTSINRQASKVDDYFHVHLKYENGPNVFITASLQVVHPLPSFVLHGTKGSYIKKRADVQEDQLEKGISPKDPNYGIEANGSEGLLATVGSDGFIKTEYHTALKGNYIRLFEAIFKHIRNDKPFPIKEEEVIWQLSILESPEPESDIRG